MKDIFEGYTSVKYNNKDINIKDAPPILQEKMMSQIISKGGKQAQEVIKFFKRFNVKLDNYSNIRI